MRLDLFLKTSRLCHRRSIAQKLCDAGFVSVNGKPAKSAHAVRLGDEISIRTRTRLLVAKVEKIPPGRNVSKNEAPTLCRVLEEKSLSDEGE